MKLGGLLSTEGLLALAATSDEASIALRWLEMIMPDEDSIADANLSSTLKVIEDTNLFVGSIKEPLNLMSVMGPARSGKSTLMNLLAGCRTSELFASSSGFETFTKGVYIPTRVLTLPAFSGLDNDPNSESTGANIKVSFIDTEGQGAVGTEYDMNLFSPALVASRVIIHNRIGGLLTEDILRDLGMMTQAALRLRSGKPETPDDTSTAAVFGHLFIVFNQFKLRGTPDEIRKVLLGEEKGNSPVIKNRNNIRKLLNENFESVQVFTLPDDLKPSDERKKFLLLEDFGPKFLESFKLLRSSLSTALASPRELVKGSPITGGAMADFMPQFAEAINKAEPLNLPSIFEGARNSAINKAVASFEQNLTLEIESLQSDRLKPTLNLDKEFEQEVLLLLAALANTLSYMPPDIVQKTQGDARKIGDTMKSTLLEANLVRLQVMLSTELNVEVAAIVNDIQAALPAGKLTVSKAEVDATCATLLQGRTARFRTRVESFDVRAAPSNYETALSSAVDTQKALLIEQVAQAWASWVSSRSTQATQELATALEALAKSTTPGDSDSYISSETKLVAAAESAFGTVLDTEYMWSEKDAARAAFKIRAEEIRIVNRGTWDRDEQKLKRSLDQLLVRLQLTYDTQLATALTPQAEPNTFDVITNASSVRSELVEFCAANKLSKNATDDVLLKFDSYVANAKMQFRPTYQKTCDIYTGWINAELGRQVPLLSIQYADRADSIPLDINSPTTNKASVAASCEAEKRNILAQLGVALTNLRVRKDGLLSKSMIDTFTDQLTRSMDVETKNKLAKYDEVVSAWNQVLLAGIVEPIITQALDNKYATVDALDADVNGDKGKRLYDLQCQGDKSPTGDARTRWNLFMTKQYPVLVNNIKAFNGFVVNGLDIDNAGTQEVQIHVIKNIYAKCADLANSLNMAWTISNNFSGDRIEATKVQEDPDDTSNRTMTFLMRNEMSDPRSNNYQWDRRYNMEFYGWSFEISEIVWGTPIVTELKPLKLDSSEFPISSSPTKVIVGTKSTETSSITNSASRTLGFKLGLEVTGGKKDVWSVKVSGEFNASWTSGSSNTATKTYETSTQAELWLPPNRANIVNQIIFNQRTSLPYTAKIRFIPKVRFKGGFTVFGKGGDYSGNPNTGALKPSFKKGDRNYEDFSFPRCDQIRDKARVNADPWDWNSWKRYNPSLTRDLLDPLADPKSYEVYVRGKWEGLTGKYAVTTVVPKSTALNLMPF